MVSEPTTRQQADEHHRRALPHHVGDTTITGKNQVSLPAKGLRELGWERGDQLLVQVVQGDMLVLMRRPTRWADAFAGKLGDVFGDHEDTIAYLNEERRSWAEGQAALAVADLDRALAGATRVLLDSSTLIAYHSPHEDVHYLTHHLLGRIEDSADRLTGYLSAVSAMELLIRPIKAGNPALTFMHTFLNSFPNLTVLPVDLEVAIQAATLRAITAIKTPDALIVASGLLENCDAIIFNDEAWGKSIQPHFRQFKWLYLKTFG